MADALFTETLKVSESKMKQTKKDPRRVSGAPRVSATKCPPATISPSSMTGSPSSASSSATSTREITSTTPFLKDVIKKEKESVESLLKLAAKIGPVAQTVVEEEKAYDAAFEAETPAPIPAYTSTLQGFTFVIFFFSYIAFTIVITVYINTITGNMANAGGTLVGLLLFGVVIFALLKRFA